MQAVQMARKGLAVMRQALAPEAAVWNARVIGTAPEELLALVGDASSVFGGSEPHGGGQSRCTER